MFMASIGAASQTFDEMMATMHLNETTDSLKTYGDLLEGLAVSKNQYIRIKYSYSICILELRIFIKILFFYDIPLGYP